MRDLTNFKEAIQAIKFNEINYGFNKEYMFVYDEDGMLDLIKRDGYAPVFEDVTDTNELYDLQKNFRWPQNKYQGTTIESFEAPRHGYGGWEVISDFFSLLNIEILE
jgi:hypothetical protein